AVLSTYALCDALRTHVRLVVTPQVTLRVTPHPADCPHRRRGTFTNPQTRGRVWALRARAALHLRVVGVGAIVIAAVARDALIALVAARVGQAVAHAHVALDEIAAAVRRQLRRSLLELQLIALPAPAALGW